MYTHNTGILQNVSLWLVNSYRKHVFDFEGKNKLIQFQNTWFYTFVIIITCILLSPPPGRPVKYI